MSEEKPRYGADDPQRRDADDVQHVGDVIQQMLEDGLWRHLAPAIRTNDTGSHARSDRQNHG